MSRECGDRGDQFIMGWRFSGMDLKSGHPYWLAKNGIINAYPPLEQDVGCDVVVIGAGITGALMADKLTREGFKVVVVDARDVGTGSTSVTTALLQYEIDTPLSELTKIHGREAAEMAYRYCYEAIDEIAGLVKGLGPEQDFGFCRKPSVYLASRSRDVKELEDEKVARDQAGIPTELWGSSEIAARFPFEADAALVSEQGAEVDAYRLAHGLLQRLQSAGGQVFDRTDVTGFEFEEESVRLTTNRGANILAKEVMICAGYESCQLLPKKIVNLNSSFAFATEPLKTSSTGGSMWWRECLLWETARPYFYMRGTTDGRVIAGGEDEGYKNASRRDAALPAKTEKLIGRLNDMFPNMNAEVAFSWAGTFGETKDGLAYIGRYKKIPRAFFALGFGGNGIIYSVIAANLAADELKGRENPLAHVYRFDR